MKKIIISFLMLTFFCFFAVGDDNWSAKFDTVSFPKQNTLQDKIFGFSKIWAEIKYNFVNIDQINFDVDSLYLAMIPEVLNTKDDIEYYDILQKFMASFNDGHTELVKGSYSWNEYNDYVPLKLTDVDGKIYITSVRKRADLDSTLVGAEILEIENLPTLDYIEKYIYPQISASTNEYRWFQAINKIQGNRKGTSLKGKVRKTTGEIFDFSILRDGETTKTPDDEYWEWSFKERKQVLEPITLEWVNNIAVLDIRRFWPEKLTQDIDSLAGLINGKAKGLIIDLRYNGGGITNVAQHMQMYLTHDDIFLSFGAQIKVNDSYGRSQGNYREEYKAFYEGKAYRTMEPDTVRVKDYIKPFDCPVVILIGRYTFSAAEDFLINMYEVPDRPLFVGESTGGSTGAPLMVPLPHEAMARVCSVRMLYPYSRKPFVGKGIQPDVIVKETLADYLEGKDLALEKALTILGGRSK